MATVEKIMERREKIGQRIEGQNGAEYVRVNHLGVKGDGRHPKHEHEQNFDEMFEVAKFHMQDRKNERDTPAKDNEQKERERIQQHVPTVDAPDERKNGE